MTEPQMMELHHAACFHAGRELTPEELRGVLLRQ
jgi:hypothetical protein